MATPEQYWEKQGNNSCAVHAVNMLLGGHVFEEADFDRAAEEFVAGCMAFKEQHWGQPDVRVPPVDHAEGAGSSVRALSSAAGVLVDEFPSHAFPTNLSNYLGALIHTPPRVGDVGHFICAKGSGGRLYLLDSLRRESSYTYTTARHVRQLVENRPTDASARTQLGRGCRGPPLAPALPQS